MSDQEKKNEFDWNAIGNVLAALAKPEVKNIWYHNQSIKLDGYKFINCRFDNCILHITSVNFDIENCYIDEATTINFGSEVAKPIRLYNSRSAWAYEQAPFFAPTKNADGTITIKA